MARIRVVDVGDPAPVIQAAGGFAVQDGDLLKIQVRQQRVQLTTSTITRVGTATDAAGNTATSGTISLTLVRDGAEGGK